MKKDRNFYVVWAMVALKKFKQTTLGKYSKWVAYIDPAYVNHFNTMIAEMDAEKSSYEEFESELRGLVARLEAGNKTDRAANSKTIISHKKSKSKTGKEKKNNGNEKT